MCRAAKDPYRQGPDLSYLIPPDRRRRDVFLLVLGAMLLGALSALGGSRLVEAADEVARVEPPPPSTLTPVPMAPIDDGPPRRVIDARRSPGIGALTVVCIPKCSEIIDNEEVLGPGHLFDRPVRSGLHRLDLYAPNGAHRRIQVEVIPDQTRELRVPMDRALAPGPGMGTGGESM